MFSPGKKLRALLFVLIFAGTASGAFAGGSCDAPVTEWKPRELLQDKLESQGLKINSITIEDGCYRAVAIDKNGNIVALVFDPRTLDRVDTQPGAPG